MRVEQSIRKCKKEDGTSKEKRFGTDLYIRNGMRTLPKKRSGLSVPLALAFSLALLACPAGVQAQTRGANFIVGECPRASGRTLEEVNARVAPLRTEAEVVLALRELFARLTSGCIPYAALRPDGKWHDRFFLVSAGRTADADMATLGSKGFGDEVIATRPQLAALLHDTLVVLDPLRLRVDMTAEDFNGADYFIQWALPGAANFMEQDLPARGDTLVLEQSLFGLENGGNVELVLRHRAKPRAVLGRAWLRFLTAEQVAELRDGLCRAHGPANPSEGERIEMALRLVTGVYGAAHAPNLSSLRCP